MKFKNIVGVLGGLAMAVAVALSSMPLPVLAVESGIETEKDKIEETEDGDETEKEEDEEEEDSNTEEDDLENPEIEDVEDTEELVVPESEADNGIDTQNDDNAIDEFEDDNDIADSSETTLGNGTQRICEIIKNKANSIKAGESSSEFVISLKDLGYDVDTMTWTSEELGIEKITEDDEMDCLYLVSDKLGIDMNDVTLILRNEPDLYWWNTKYYQALEGFKVLDGGNKISITGISIYLPVSAKYRLDDDKRWVDANCEALKVAQRAVDNAKKIVEAAKSYNDIEKLRYYSEQICNYNIYNHEYYENLNQGDDLDTNASQYVYVFDNDDETNVVCEGYAKSLKLLCDMTDFDNETIECYNVSGYLCDVDENGELVNPGGHMWNIVSIDGKSYIIDLTNSDKNDKNESNQFNGNFFLNAPDRGSVEEGYVYYNSAGFVYYSTMEKIYGNGILALSDSDYEMPDTDSQEPTKDSSNNGGDENDVADSSGTTLGKGTQKICEIVMDKADSIKAGESSSYIEIPLSELGYDDVMTWTPEELGYDVFREEDGDEIYSRAYNAALEKLDIDIYDVLLNLRNELELYWWDTSLAPGLAGFDGTDETVSITGITINMPVSLKYRLNDNKNWVDPNCDVLKVAELAKDNAEKIVEAAKSYDDIEKLRYYSEQICNSNTYDRDYYNKTVAEEPDLDTNSSQFLYVFDNDDTTNVVCEGYAKALKLLCDMTEFDKSIQCYTVLGDVRELDENGDVSEVGGGHMWNIIRIDGKSYLIDLTSSDNNDHSDSQFNGNIFLNAPDKGDAETGYVYYNKWFVLKYYSTMKKIYGKDILTLSDSDYELPDTDSQEPTEDSTTEDVITEDVITEDVTTNDVTTEDSTTEETTTETSNSEDSSSNEETENVSASTVAGNEPVVEDSKGWDSFDEKVEKAVEKGIVNVDLNGTDTIPEKVISTIAENNVTMAVKVDKNTLVTIDGSKITPAEASEVKLISSKNADGSETVGVRSQNVDIEKSIVIFRNVGIDKVGKSTVLYFENADKSLIEFRTSPVYENGFAAFEVPFVNANYKVALK